MSSNGILGSQQPLKVIQSNNIDFTADIEIRGEDLTSAVGRATASGDTTLVTPSAGKKLLVKKVSISPSAAITGTVKFLIGATEITRVENPGVYGSYEDNWIPDGVLGAINDVLKINLPDTTPVTWTTQYVEI